MSRVVNVRSRLQSGCLKLIKIVYRERIPLSSLIIWTGHRTRGHLDGNRQSRRTRWRTPFLFFCGRKTTLLETPNVLQFIFHQSLILKYTSTSPIRWSCHPPAVTHTHIHVNLYGLPVSLTDFCLVFMLTAVSWKPYGFLKILPEKFNFPLSTSNTLFSRGDVFSILVGSLDAARSI